MLTMNIHQHTLSCLLRDLSGYNYISVDNAVPPDVSFALKSDDENVAGIEWVIKNTRGIMLVSSVLIDISTFAEYHGFEITENNRNSIMQDVETYLFSVEEEIQNINARDKTIITLDKNECRLYLLIPNTDTDSTLTNSIITLLDLIPEIQIR